MTDNITVIVEWFEPSFINDNFVCIVFVKEQRHTQSFLLAYCIHVINNTHNTLADRRTANMYTHVHVWFVVSYSNNV